MGRLSCVLASPLLLLAVSRSLVVNRTAHDIKQLAGDGLLPALVVLQVEFTENLIGIISSRLHCHHTGCMFRGDGVEQSGIEHKMGKLRNKLVHHGVEVGLNDEVVIQRFPVKLAFVLFCMLFVALALLFMTWFLRTRLGLAIRATGNNPDMVKSSSINPAFTTIVGLCLSNSLTALSGCLLAQSQKSVNVTIGSGMVTIALASLLIGRAFMGKGGIGIRAVGAVLGAFVFRLVYTIALRFNLPAYMLKLVSSVIVIIAIAGPYFRKRFPAFRRIHDASRRERNA